MTSTLADRVLAGDPRAIARAISLIEDEDPASADLVRAIFPADRPRVSHRRHRSAGRGQEHARRPADHQPENAKAAKRAKPRTLCGLGGLCVPPRSV